MMTAVNDGDSPVAAFTSRRYAQAFVTSTWSKPCIAGLWWVDRITSLMKRLPFGYGITWSSLCCFIVSSLLELIHVEFGSGDGTEILSGCMAPLERSGEFPVSANRRTRGQQLA